MKFRVLCLVLLLSFFSASPHAEVSASNINVFPPEILFHGKPIEPGCFFSPLVLKEGASWEIEEKCHEPEHDGGPLMVGAIVTNPDGSIGYSHMTEDGRTKEFFYKYLGITNEGFLVQTNYTTGGTGHWQFVDLYRREGDRLVFIKQILGGDRTGNIKYENGNLYHSYGIRDSDLFVKYAHGTYNEALENGFNGCERCYAATVNEVNGKTVTIELANLEHRLAKIPECFQPTYTDALARQKKFSEDEVKEIFSRYYLVCPAKAKQKQE